jgi:hypothetical protein
MNFDEQPDSSAGELTESEKQMAHERTALRAALIHEAIRAEGELARTASALTWSGLAGGLSMGFSLVATGLLRAHSLSNSLRPRSSATPSAASCWWGSSIMLKGSPRPGTIETCG